MQSIKELYKIGHGPSSSHTMGPKKAAEIFLNNNKNSSKFTVTLYGSLAATGKGHLTDAAILDTLHPIETEIIWKPDEILPYHPNAMNFKSFNQSNELQKEWIVYSTGGGTIKDESSEIFLPEIYSQSKMSDIIKELDRTGETFWEYVYRIEGKSINEFLFTIWKAMKKSVQSGLENEGVLPGELNFPRKANSFYIKSRNSNGFQKVRNLLFSYALAVAEENASGGRVVASPTCGSSGVLPAVLLSIQELYNFSDLKMVRALATAGLIGNIVKTNGSISGAEVGCQGEIGTSCAMASGAAAQLMGGTLRQIEYAAEMGLEHHLGLTCDPIAGLVQIPCIERNAMGASRAIDCAFYSLLSDGRHRISFDEVVETMMQTGLDLKYSYKETSEGGLARMHKKMS